MTKAPATLIHPSIVSRKTVRIVLMIIALYDFEMKSADILNKDVHAPVRGNRLILLDSEFGSDVGKTAVV